MLIGLSGYARSGKDTVAEYLVAEHGFTRIAFADPMREALYRLNPLISIHDMTHVPLASAIDGMGWEEVKAASADLRGLLQRMGTEVGRELFGQNFWVGQALARAARHENVVFSDVRFLNEANAIRNLNGSVIRVTRPGTDPANSHTSETSLDNYHFNETIVNDSSIEELHDKMNEIMVAIKEARLF